MPYTQPRRAIVIGAGMGGLAVAGALAPYFAHVTVLERDALTAKAAPRKGTPQCRQPHALLVGGLQALCEIFPGFDDDLARAGAAPVRQNLDIRLEQPGRDFMPRRDLGLPLSYFMTRPLLELTLRERVLTVGNVEIRPRAEVLGLIAGEAGGDVTGVRFDEGGGEKALAGDLTIDASGRGAPTLAFLEAAGFAAPEEEVVEMGLGYASVVLSRPRREDDWLAAITMPEAPADRYGMFLMPIEGGRWMATIDSMNDAELPEDWPAFLARAKALRTPTLHEAIKDCAPLSDVARFRRGRSVLRHFERLADFPGGLIAFGDAVCQFNPIHGQGMSVAAQQAVALNRLLAERDGSARSLEGLAKAFFDAALGVIETPWSWSTSFDFRFPATLGERPPGFAARASFNAALTELAARDPATQRLLVEVANCMKPNAAFAQPALVQAVLAIMNEAEGEPA